MQLNQFEKDELTNKIADVFTELDNTPFGKHCSEHLTFKGNPESEAEEAKNLTRKWREECTIRRVGCGDLAFTTSLTDIISYAVNIISDQKKFQDTEFCKKYYPDIFKEADSAIEKINNLKRLFLRRDNTNKEKHVTHNPTHTRQALTLREKSSAVSLNEKMDIVIKQQEVILREQQEIKDQLTKKSNHLETLALKAKISALSSQVDQLTTQLIEQPKVAPKEEDAASARKNSFFRKK